MMEWKRFKNSRYPYQSIIPFPKEAIVLVRNKYGEFTVGPAKKFWWGYESEMNEIGYNVIMSAKRLDRPK